MNNLKSYTEYAVTTPTTDFVIGFDFNYGTDAVNITVDDVPAIEAGYTVIYLNSTTMRLSPAVPSGVVRLQRETDIDVQDNQFTAGAKFNAGNMDENFTQIRHSQQEVRDGFEKLSEDTYEIIDTLQVVGEAAQDAADAAEQAAQTANAAAEQVNDKVSYQDLDNTIAATPHNNLQNRDAAGAHTASAILDASGNTQQEINNGITDRKSVKLWSTGVVDALSKYNSVDFDEDENIDAPVALMSGQNITSNNHELNQASPTTIAIESDFAASDTFISGLHIVQDKSGLIGGGVNNNHASIKYRGGLRNIVKNIVIDGQLGVSFGAGDASAVDRRSMYNSAANIVMLNTHMGIEHIGASYNHTRGIVISPTEFKGIFHGIRLTGYDTLENPSEINAPCHGNTGSDYFIKNMTNGISVQNSAKYNSYDRVFVTLCDRAVQVVPGTAIGNNPTMNHFDVVGEKIGQAIWNEGGNHNDFEILIDGGAFTDQGIQERAGYSGKGFNRYSGIIKNSAKTAAQFRYSHNLYGLQVSKAIGNGANISGNYGSGQITVDGATGAGVSVFGNYNNLQVVATECLIGMGVSGIGNIVNIQTDGNVHVSGSGNTIIGRIGGSLTVTGNDNKFIGEVVGTVTRTGTTGNDFTGLKGWSGNIVLSEQITNGSGRVTVAVPKHTNAQIRTIYAAIPLNTTEWSLKVISIAGENVTFELQDNSGNAVTSTSVTFNYSYSCS